MAGRPRILLTHTSDMRANYYGDDATTGLRALGDLVLHDGREPLDGDRLVAAAQGCRLIIADRNTPGRAEIFGRLPDAVAFLRVAVDISTIDVAAASKVGILVTQASRTWVPAVAEMAIGLMIDISRSVSRSDRAYKAGEAEPEARMGRQLAGATAGIIGYGPFGRRVAELASAFGMTVLVHDPYVAVDQPGIAQVPLNELLARSDFVLPLAVATPETENLINDATLGRMKRGAYLINMSRGNLVDEAALERALDAGRLAGAALDVGRAPDQKPSPRLAARADVVATPHVGGLTRQAIEGQALETVAQARDILAGHVPKGAVNAPHATRLAQARHAAPRPRDR